MLSIQLKFQTLHLLLSITQAVAMRFFILATMISAAFVSTAPTANDF